MNSQSSAVREEMLSGDPSVSSPVRYPLTARRYLLTALGPKRPRTDHNPLNRKEYLLHVARRV